MKISTIQTLLALVFVIPALTSCHRIQDEFAIMENEREQVENAIHNCIGWAKEKNIELLYSIIANDVHYIEVNPSDRIVHGFQEFRGAEDFWMSDDFKAISYDIRDLKITFSKSGDVAWFFCMLDDMNEWQGEPANWEHTRWTGVLEKRLGKWIMVQMHFSFASA